MSPIACAKALPLGPPLAILYTASQTSCSRVGSNVAERAAPSLSRAGCLGKYLDAATCHPEHQVNSCWGLLVAADAQAAQEFGDHTDISDAAAHSASSGGASAQLRTSAAWLRPPA